MTSIFSALNTIADDELTKHQANSSPVMIVNLLARNIRVLVPEGLSPCINKRGSFQVLLLFFCPKLMLSFWHIVSDCTEWIRRHYPSRRTRQFLFHDPQILSKRFQVQRLRWHVPPYGTSTNSFCVFGWKECRPICLCDWCQWKPLQWIKRCHCFSAILLSGKENLLLWHWFEWRTETTGMMFTQNSISFI